MSTAVQPLDAHAEPEDYFPVTLSHLRLDTVVGFDLYWHSESAGAPVLYRHRDLEFSDDVRNRLLEHRVQNLWVHRDQETLYNRYMEQNVRAALSDPALPSEEKSRILYSTSYDMIREFLADPMTQEMIPRTRNIVGAAIEHMLAEQSALASFLKTASLDYKTYTHSVNVAMYTLHLAQRIGYKDPQLLEDIGIGTFLHDIGKCHVPERILNKPGKLTASEWRIIKKHPVWGCQILSVHGVQSPRVLAIARDHHEKVDGSGYPFGIQGPELPEYVRMTTICDVFDALSTTRAYKAGMHSYEALDVMKSEMNNQLDPKLFAEFVQMLRL
jgi:putative nucleotidyltransferase with HDIG domain